MEEAAVFNRAGIAHHAAGRYEDALREYQKAIDLKPDHCEVFYNMGLSLLALHRMDQAQSAFDAILKIIPLNVPARYQLGKISFLKRDYQIAVDHFSIARQQNPDLFELYLNLGHCYLELNEPHEAEKYYQAALLFETDEAQVCFNLGVAAEAQSAWQRAMGYYQDALKYHPDYFEACNNIAVMMLRSQNLPQALAHFKRALAMKPGSAALQYIVDMISQDKRLEAAPTEYVKQLFDSYADLFEQHVRESLNYQIPEVLLSVFEKEKPSAKHLSVLDLGCGTGLCGPLFAPFAQKLVGVDLSENMLSLAAQKKVYDELISDDMNHFLEGKFSAFDLILAADVFVYVGRLETIFSLVSEALKPGGHFLFSVEASWSDKEFVSHSSGRFSHSQPYVQFLAQQQGLKIIEVQQVVSREQRGQPVFAFVFLLRK